MALSCTSDESCNDPVQSILNIGFYTITNGVENDTSVSVFSVNGIVANDSILYDSVNNVSKLTLPLSPFSNASSFIFTFTIPYDRYDSGSVPIIDTIVLDADTSWLDPITIDTIVFIPDTLWMDSIYVNIVPDTYPLSDTLIFNYQTRLSLISTECGFAHIFDLEKITSTHHVIQIDTITKPEITTSDEENVKIYF